MRILKSITNFFVLALAGILLTVLTFSPAYSRSIALGRQGDAALIATLVAESAESDEGECAASLFGDDSMDYY